MTGGLFDPLGTNRTEIPRGAVRHSVPAVLAGLALAGLAALVAVSYLRDDGNRGRPVATAPIAHTVAPPKPPVPEPAAVPAPRDPPAMPGGLSPGQVDQEVEIQNGVRVIRPRRTPQAPVGTGSVTVLPGAPPAGSR